MPGFTVIVGSMIFGLACFFVGMIVGFKLGIEWGIDEMKKRLDEKGVVVTTRTKGGHAT